MPSTYSFGVRQENPLVRGIDKHKLHHAKIETDCCSNASDKHFGGLRNRKTRNTINTFSRVFILGVVKK